MSSSEIVMSHYEEKKSFETMFTKKVGKTNNRFEVEGKRKPRFQSGDETSLQLSRVKPRSTRVNTS